MATKSPTSCLLLPYDSSDEESNDQISDAEEPSLPVHEAAPSTSTNHSDHVNSKELERGGLAIDTSASTAIVKSALKRKNPYALGLNQRLSKGFSLR